MWLQQEFWRTFRLRAETKALLTPGREKRTSQYWLQHIFSFSFFTLAWQNTFVIHVVDSIIKITAASQQPLAFLKPPKGSLEKDPSSHMQPSEHGSMGRTGLSLSLCFHTSLHFKHSYKKAIDFWYFPWGKGPKIKKNVENDRSEAEQNGHSSHSELQTTLRAEEPRGNNHPYWETRAKEEMFALKMQISLGKL